MMMNSLLLNDYNGKKLTDSEIKLMKYYDDKKDTFYSNEQDIMREKMFIAQAQRLLDVPTIRDTNNTKNNVNVNVNTNTNNDVMNDDDNDNNNDDDDDSSTIKTNNIEELKRKYDSIQSDNTNNSTKKEKTIHTNIINNSNDDDGKKKVTPPPPPLQQKNTEPKKSNNTKIKKLKQVEDIDDYSSDESIPDFYKSSKVLHSIDWNPSTLNEGQSWHLNEFNVNYKQTLILKVTIPMKAKKWTINICPNHNIAFNDILFHINFRKHKSWVVFNDRIGTWGDSIKLKYPMTKTSTYEVMIQIRTEGFCLFIDNNFFGILSHRRSINDFEDLLLSIPARGADFEEEEVIVHKIWWGYKSPEFDKISTEKLRNQINEQQDKMPDTPYYDRTLLISGLPPCTDREVQYSQELALEEIFPEHESVSLPPNKDKAFIRFPKPSNVDSAIEEYDGMQMAGENSGIYTLKLSKLTNTSII